MAAITRKELNRLQESERILASAIDVSKDLLRAKSDLCKSVEYEAAWKKFWKDWYFRASDKVEELKSKLWAAEQEIHDLKREREIEREIGQEVCDRVLVLENWNALQFVIQEIQPNPEPEQIIPPPCLKPLDAMKWNESVVTGSISYRG